MKIFLFIIVLFFSIATTAQNPYAAWHKQTEADRLQGDSLFPGDPIPIEKEQATEYFIYAEKLYRQDSLIKAGQIFDRLYWLDTASAQGQQALVYRQQIEQALIQISKAALQHTWDWTAGGTNWGMTDSPAKAGKTKQIVLDGNTIAFYVNNKLIRQTTYVFAENFSWFYGYCNNILVYEDTKETYYFELGPNYPFNSETLWIEKKTNIVCGTYEESYVLRKGNPPIAKK